MDKTKYYKETVDRFLGEVKTVCHAMIEGEHVSNSPVELVKEALKYLDEKYEDLKKQEINKIKESTLSS